METREFYRCCKHCEHRPDYQADEHDRPCPEGCNDEYDGTEDDLMTAEELARDRADAGLEPPKGAA